MTVRQKEAVQLMGELNSASEVAERMGITSQAVNALLDRSGYRLPEDHPMRSKVGKQRCARCGRWCRKDASGRISGDKVKRFCARDENEECWRGRLTDQRRLERGPSDKQRMRAAITVVLSWRRSRPRKLDLEVSLALSTIEEIAEKWHWGQYGRSSDA